MQIKPIIGGEFVDSASGKTFESVNPATQDVVATVAGAGRGRRPGRRGREEGVRRRSLAQDQSRREEEVLYWVADLIESRLEEIACGRP